jgi:transcriptional regulator with XRE-family HTH domain
VTRRRNGVEQKGDPKIGQRIRALRDRKNMSQKELAERSDLSGMALSLIERNRSSPTLVTLVALAQACGVKVTDFFSDDGKQEVDDGRKEPDHVVFRSDNGMRRNAVDVLATNLKGSNLNLFLARLGPNKKGRRNRCFHPGEEFVYCLTGQIECKVGKERIILEPGDAITYRGNIPHLITTAGRAASDALIVIGADVGRCLYDKLYSPVCSHSHFDSRAGVESDSSGADPDASRILFLPSLVCGSSKCFVNT